MKTNMPKPSEIFDTPEAISQVGDHKKPIRICNKTGVHTCRLGSIHLNEREALILNEHLTIKDQEKEEAIRAERERIKALFPKLNPNSTSWGTAEMERILKALPTEDNK